MVMVMVMVMALVNVSVRHSGFAVPVSSSLTQWTVISSLHLSSVRCLAKRAVQNTRDGDGDGDGCDGDGPTVHVMFKSGGDTWTSSNHCSHRCI